jgi:two-component system phosphate regulon sensor histidine kinase PhoR
LNEAGRIVLLNPSARRILDVTEDAALGRHYLEVIRHAGLADLIGQSKDGQTVAQGELELLGPEDRTFSVNVGAVRDASEHVLGQIMVFADISALKRLMKMRSDFAANVSHELKTPLTAILGYVETLQAGAIDDKKIRGQFLEKISSQSRRLHDLIEDVLELSRIESGRKLETFEKVRLKESIGAAVEVLKTNAQAKRIRIVDSVPESFAVKAQSDGLQRIFVNLLDNAVKYSPEDTAITLSSEATEDGWTVVRVADEGYGIPTQHLSRVFERFYRAEMSRSRSAGGTGLGLAIVKHLAERFGGTVSVESAEGKGSVFTVVLPTA